MEFRETAKEASMTTTIVAIDHAPSSQIASVAVEWDSHHPPHHHHTRIFDDMAETDVAMIVSEREYHTLWAGARIWQWLLSNVGGRARELAAAWTEIASNGGSINPLTADEVGLLEGRNLGAIQPIDLGRAAWDKIVSYAAESAVGALIAAGHLVAAIDYLIYVHSFPANEARAAVAWAMKETEKGNDD
jgi:hypothetical protein